MKQWPNPTRDTLLFGLGILGAFHETVLWTGTEREALIILFGAMMGLPVFLNIDEKHRNGNGKNGASA